MIQFTITSVYPSNTYTTTKNAYTDHLVSSNKEDLEKNIIDIIVEFMYEFCSKEYGHNITITSYDDFCEKWWEYQECFMYLHKDIFEIKYFENEMWKDFQLDIDFKNKIYHTFLEKK